MDLLRVLDLEPMPPGFLGRNLLEGGGQVVFGGQMLAQAVVAAARTIPDKSVLSLQCSFARGARPDEPLQIGIDTISDGRSFGVVDVTMRQGAQPCARSIVHMHVADEDLVRHQDAAPLTQPPDRLPERGRLPWWEVRYDEAIDLLDPESVGPPKLDLWSRFPEAPGDLTTSQALLSYASDMYLIATAMRPHEGVGQSLAHSAVSTTVLTQALTFHEPFDASQWLLISHESPYAGRGRSYGRANAFREDGQLVASFAQTNMIRTFPNHLRPAPGQRSAY